MIQAKTHTTPAKKTSLFVGRLTCTPEHGNVGDRVTLSGVNLPVDKSLQLIWETYTTDWNIEQRDGVDWNQFRGIRVESEALVLLKVKTDSKGSFEAEFEVPEGVGGLHDIYLMDGKNKLNKTGFRVDMSATITPDHGPLGTPIEINVKGVNTAHPIEGWYQLYYDNQLSGFVTAVRSNGSARFEIVACGDAGTHIIALEDASFGVPYLGLECSPYNYLKTFSMKFELTQGEAILPGSIKEQLQPELPGLKPQGPGEQLWTDFSEVPCGAMFQIYGKGFSANQQVKVRWLDIAGDRVSEMQEGKFGTGFSEIPVPLGEAMADEAGEFSLRVVPESVQGGAHVVEAWDGANTLAQTYVRMSKRAHPLRPKAGPVGTPITVEIDGVSWTEHENLVAINYDNSLVGYACGNDLMGKVMAKLHATGKPGWHFIDVYPAFRTRRFSVGLDEEIMEVPYLYQKSILTWNDHPHGFHFRYAFKLENDDAASL